MDTSPLIASEPARRRLPLRQTILWSLGTALRNWLLILPISLLAFYVTPLALGAVRASLSSALLPGGAVVLPTGLPVTSVLDVVLGLAFTAATYVLGAIGVGAICTAIWPSMAGRFDSPTPRSVYVDLRPSIGRLARTGLLIGVGVWLLQTVAGLMSSGIGRNVGDVADPAEYVRALDAAQITGQLLINGLVTAGVLLLLVRCFVVAPVVIFEECSGMGAVERSRELVAGNGWRVLVMLLIVGVIRQLGSTAVALIDVLPHSLDSDALHSAKLALGVLPATLDLVALPLLALWMGASYIQLRERHVLQDEPESAS